MKFFNSSSGMSLSEMVVGLALLTLMSMGGAFVLKDTKKVEVQITQQQIVDQTHQLRLQQARSLSTVSRWIGIPRRVGPGSGSNSADSRNDRQSPSPTNSQGQRRETSGGGRQNPNQTPPSQEPSQSQIQSAGPMESCFSGQARNINCSQFAVQDQIALNESPGNGITSVVRFSRNCTATACNEVVLRITTEGVDGDEQVVIRRENTVRFPGLFFGEVPRLNYACSLNNNSALGGINFSELEANCMSGPQLSCDLSAPIGDWSQSQVTSCAQMENRDCGDIGVEMGSPFLMRSRCQQARLAASLPLNPNWETGSGGPPGPPACGYSPWAVSSTGPWSVPARSCGTRVITETRSLTSGAAATCTAPLSRNTSENRPCAGGPGPSGGGGCHVCWAPDVSPNQECPELSPGEVFTVGGPPMRVLSVGSDIVTTNLGGGAQAFRCPMPPVTPTTCGSGESLLTCDIPNRNSCQAQYIASGQADWCRRAAEDLVAGNTYFCCGRNTNLRWRVLHRQDEQCFSAGGPAQYTGGGCASFRTSGPDGACSTLGEGCRYRSCVGTSLTIIDYRCGP